MQSVVVYESMYGNTHLIADAIAKGLATYGEVHVMPVAKADQARIADADLVVVGGPTHVHGMSRPSTRKAAIGAAEKPGSDLHLDPDADGTGLKEWFAAMDGTTGCAAAYDTRAPGPEVLTGRASKRIGRLLRQRGFTLLVEPESFIVTRNNHLEPDEMRHARSWGLELGAIFTQRQLQRSVEQLASKRRRAVRPSRSPDAPATEPLTRSR